MSFRLIHADVLDGLHIGLGSLPMRDLWITTHRMVMDLVAKREAQ